MKNFFQILLLTTGTIFSLGLTELGFRIYVYAFEKDFTKDLLHEALPIQLDNFLGWIPEPGHSSTKNLWDKKITILEDSTRSNGEPRREGPSILAVGDSFTFGDQVSDQETWPAYLQALLKQNVINGGVSAYGIDQALIRARFLMDQYSPKTVILGVFQDDIARTGQSIRQGLAKPFYTMGGDKLTLHLLPPGYAHKLQQSEIEKRRRNWLRKISDQSFAMSYLMAKSFPFSWHLSGVSVGIHNEPEKVSCLLLKDFAEETAKKGIRFILFTLYSIDEIPNPPSQAPINTELRDLFHCAAHPRIEMLDLFPSLLKMKAENPSKFRSLFSGHMTIKGNAFVATSLAEFMF